MSDEISSRALPQAPKDPCRCTPLHRPDCAYFKGGSGESQFPCGKCDNETACLNRASCALAAPVASCSETVAWESLTSVIRPMIESVCSDGNSNAARLAKDIADALLAGPLHGSSEVTREALKKLSDWCEAERYKLGAVDGYDYRSGEEFGIRRVELQIEKTLHALRDDGASPRSES